MTGPLRPMPGDSLPPLHDELARRAVGTSDAQALHVEVVTLTAVVQALVDELRKPSPTLDWKAGLYQRLTSRKFWAFIVGLLTIVITTWQTNPDPRYAVGAIAVAVVGYLAAQSHEDAAKAKAASTKE